MSDKKIRTKFYYSKQPSLWWQLSAPCVQVIFYPIHRHARQNVDKQEKCQQDARGHIDLACQYHKGACQHK